jgi:Protein of unknown function (DUF3631)
MTARLHLVEGDEDALWYGSILLNQTEGFLRRFVAYPSEDASVAHTLWIFHTHLMGCWESTPRLAFLSAERGSGKTRALEVTGLLVPNSVQAVNVTPAYLFRKVGDQDNPPTILYDEVDTLFGSKVTDTGEIRALLNAGHRRGAVTGRCVIIGKRVETEEIPAYCAVALAGIGDLPDTIGSRSIIIDMRRRAPDECVEPFRPRIHESAGAGIKTMIENWCTAQAPALATAEPVFPDGIADRDADCWEALLAIADAAGDAWPQRARAAAVALVARGADRTRTFGVQLLADLREVFGTADKLASAVIVARLRDLPESAWNDIRGKALDERGLAYRLRKYGAKPKSLRLPSGHVQRGYEVADLHDAWARYLPTPESPLQPLQALHPAENSQKSVAGKAGVADGELLQASGSATEKSAENSQKSEPVADVADVAVKSDKAGDVTDNDPFAAFLDPSRRLQPGG